MYIRSESKSAFIETLSKLEAFKTLFDSENISESSIDTSQESLEDIFRSKNTDDWLELINNDQVLAVPNVSLGELKNTNWVRDLGLIINRDHPGRGSVDHLGSTATLSRTPMTLGRPTPILGSESTDVLTDLGYNSQDIKTLINEGILVTDENSPIAQG